MEFLLKMVRITFIFGVISQSYPLDQQKHTQITQNYVLF